MGLNPLPWSDYVASEYCSVRGEYAAMLPSGAASSAAGEYPFVQHNNLSWHIPLEDLREGEVASGAIGQELYGAGGTFMFAAYSQ